MKFTDLLDVAGLLLVVAALLVAVGPAAGMAAAGLACLLVSWRSSQ